MRAPFKKLFLARYVQILEAVGFVLIGLLIATMIVSAVYRIDDGVKFRLDAVRPQMYPVELPSTRVWVRTVDVRAGQRVEAGDACATVMTDETVIALVGAEADLRRAESAVGVSARPEVSRELPGLVAAASAAVDRAAGTAAAVTVRAPVGGIVRESAERRLGDLVGRVIDGALMTVENYDSLRIEIPLSGENAARVRIHLLAEEDIRDWRELTRLLRGEDPAPSEAVARIRGMLAGRMDGIRPGRVPLKRDQPEVVRALNAILEDAGLHEASAWPADLPSEARALLETDPAELSRDDRIRLNRILLENGLGDAIAESRGEQQAVKITFHVPRAQVGPAGAGRKSKAEPYPMQGRVIAEPEGGKVIGEFPAPEPGLTEALRARAEDDRLDPVVAVGSVVVGRVTLFRFLFR